MNNKQKHIAETYQAFKGGARNMVKLFEGLIQDYWGQDNRDLSNLEFLLNISKDTPRIQADISVLISRHTGCKASKEAGKWALTNEDLSKKKKAALEKGVAKFIGAEWPTLQDARMGIPSDKGGDKPAPDYSKRVSKVVVTALTDGGMKVEQLMLLLEEAAIEADLIKQKQKMKEANKVVQIKPENYQKEEKKVTMDSLYEQLPDKVQALIEKEEYPSEEQLKEMGYKEKESREIIEIISQYLEKELAVIGKAVANA